jgi:hypothetical protein
MMQGDFTKESSYTIILLSPKPSVLVWLHGSNAVFRIAGRQNLPNCGASISSDGALQSPSLTQKSMATPAITDRACYRLLRSPLIFLTGAEPANQLIHVHAAEFMHVAECWTGRRARIGHVRLQHVIA